MSTSIRLLPLPVRATPPPSPRSPPFTPLLHLTLPPLRFLLTYALTATTLSHSNKGCLMVFSCHHVSTRFAPPAGTLLSRSSTPLRSILPYLVPSAPFVAPSLPPLPTSSILYPTPAPVASTTASDASQSTSIPLTTPPLRHTPPFTPLQPLLIPSYTFSPHPAVLQSNRPQTFSSANLFGPLRTQSLLPSPSTSLATPFAGIRQGHSLIQGYHANPPPSLSSITSPDTASFSPTSSPTPSTHPSPLSHAFSSPPGSPLLLFQLVPSTLRSDFSRSTAAPASSTDPLLPSPIPPPRISSAASPHPPALPTPTAPSPPHQIASHPPDGINRLTLDPASIHASASDAPPHDLQVSNIGIDGSPLLPESAPLVDDPQPHFVPAAYFSHQAPIRT